MKMKVNISPKVKSAISSKIFIALFFTLFGIGGTVLAHNVKEQTQAKQSSESFPTWPDRIDKEFSNIHDPFFSDAFFADMRRMQHHMDAMFERHHRYMNHVFHEAKHNKKVAKTHISKTEDDKAYYYALNFEGYDKDDVLVAVKDGALSFAAKKEEKQEQEDNKSYAKSNFYYSFLLPRDVVKKEPKIVREDNKVVVEFLK